MRIGYLTNTYPATSSTFIRREIHALEDEGCVVKRYAVRQWSQNLVDQDDISEKDQTQYLLDGRKIQVVSGFFPEILRNPAGILRAAGTLLRLIRNKGGGLIHHAAYFLEAIRLKRLASADRVEHIHVHFSTNATAVALLCRHLGGPTFSFTAHGPDEFLDVAGNSLALKTRESQFVVAISNFCRVQIALAAGVEAWNKIHIVGCGIDTDEFALSSHPFAQDAPFVVIGRLCPQKAQVHIVRALADVVKTHPDVRIVMIGDGESRQDVEAEIARHALQDNITLLGWQDSATVRAHLSKARALLLPSFAEGLPVCIMESLSLGRPVISTYIAGIPELVDPECGWLIPAGAPDKIGEAICAALDTSAERLSEMGQEGRRRVIERHNVFANARRIRQLFHDVNHGTKHDTAT